MNEKDKKNKVNILFVCLGNICRSPMAEGVMLKKIKEKGLSNKIKVDSAGTAAYHVGESPDKRMLEVAFERGYKLEHRCRQVRCVDFKDFDYIIGMDESNIYNLENLAITLADTEKIYRMTDFCTQHNTDHVPDPYYGGRAGFQFVIDLLEDACDGLIAHLLLKH